MRKENPILNKYRIKDGAYGSNSSYGMQGAFLINRNHIELQVISSGSWTGEFQNDFHKWEHVSVSTKKRNPNWDEMNFIKELFWDDHETVVQFHPKKSEYINLHPHCLHLWKMVGIDWQLPPVGAV